MFPLSFPSKALRREQRSTAVVLDPFCGRGTTLFAARLRGLAAYGMDSNPTAAAIAAAKLVTTTPSAILRSFDRIIANRAIISVPQGEFWSWAYNAGTLEMLCTLRASLLEDCSSNSRIALRGLILGLLHGPLRKGLPAYFSNQMPRTFAPKPAYSTRYWKEREMRPPRVDVRQLVARKAEWFYGAKHCAIPGNVILGDSRSKNAYSRLLAGQRVDWIITSPPYYGMRTYIPDQWLRLWFAGGPATPLYTVDGQLTHQSTEDFATELRSVWVHCKRVARKGCNLLIRFGSINDRKAEPVALLKQSLNESGWMIKTIREAGSAADGRRQADHFQSSELGANPEYDFWARLER